MEIKVGDLVWEVLNKFGTVIKVKGERVAIYWHTPTLRWRENTNYLKPEYHVKYVRQWKRNVEDMGR
jgi:hypothetical protein